MGTKVMSENLLRTATILNGASLSDEVNLSGATLMGIVMPAAWTTASLTFQVSSTSGGTFQSLYDDSGNEVTVTAAQGTTVSLDSTALKLAPYRYIKIRSGTTASAVNQGADRILQVIMKG